MKQVFLFLFLFIGLSNLIAKDISTYLIGSYVDAKDASQRLQDAGFEVLASYESVKDGQTLVFTNEALKNQGAKTGRAHVAVGRLFIDSKEKKISFTNPVYFGKAFMQDEYDARVFEQIAEDIKRIFTGLENSKDKLDENDLEHYHFMMGMPYYEDSDILAESSNTELLKKARTFKKGKELVFELKISDSTTLLGYSLAKRTKKFVEKIGRQNGAILPYTVCIENGKASALEAKYYIAVSYPLLTMTTFTTIATVPGAIKKDLAKAFK
ncbi:MAG: hypothetical protein JXQ67_01105 [Campylobacterales bacterium]|nr:hypothetical protein [Campylobacterales bacterium]